MLFPQQHQLDVADNVRRETAPHTPAQHKADFGQFMTPAGVARFMASLFPPSSLPTCRLLDAGAGVGALSCAFLDRWVSGAGGFDFGAVEATAYEVDPQLLGHLEQHLSSYQGVTPRVVAGDYIERATARGLWRRGYTHAILNPPYKKINSASLHRLALRAVGIETVNLYSAFMALAVAEAAPGAQIVAIIPRSFCNGPYYRPFRDFLLERVAIRRLHLFASRNSAFKDDGVLQENIIVHLERDGEQGPVTVSTSTDDRFADLVLHEHPFARIVFPDDPERFIHVPTSPEPDAIESATLVRYPLTDLGLKVSTGPVVDFRLKDHLRDMPGLDTVPLLYPGHFGGGTGLGVGATWPIAGLKKPNAIVRNADTERWLYPNGFYCVVRRFSTKEEKRRIVASVVAPEAFEASADASVLGFENHLNVFHENRQGLPEALARGLAVFLNTTAVDEQFRRFNGHTQVNATDLKQMKYPDRDALVRLGEWVMRYGQDHGGAAPPQAEIDARFATLMVSA